MNIIRTIAIVAVIAVSGAVVAGCNNCCEPNPCDPCAAN